MIVHKGSLNAFVPFGHIDAVTMGSTLGISDAVMFGAAALVAHAPNGANREPG
jgi:hypothetical protein